MRELNTFRIQLETQIWGDLGFNSVVEVAVSDEMIAFYLGSPVREVTPVNLARFVAGVKTLAMVKGVAVAVGLGHDRESGRDVVVITKAPRDETSPESGYLDETW